MQFPYRYSTRAVLSLAEAYFPWEIWRRNGPYWLFQVASGTAAAAHELSGVCVFIWQEAVASNTEDLLPKSSTISNLELHYLFRQDFLAANLISFSACSAVKRKAGAVCDGAQSVACAPWQCPGSAGLGGAEAGAPWGRAAVAPGPAARVLVGCIPERFPLGTPGPPPCTGSPSASLAFRLNVIIPLLHPWPS